MTLAGDLVLFTQLIHLLLKAVDERALLPSTPLKNAGIQIVNEIQRIKTLLAELTRLVQTTV